jgi:hypothetical protein
MPSNSNGPLTCFKETLEDIREDAPDDSKGVLVAVNGQSFPLPDIVRSNIIKSEDVVGVAVREQDCVQAVEANAEGLLAEIRAGVNYHVVAAAGNEQGRAEPLIVGIVRMAHAARAAERGHAHRSSGTENGDF